MPGWAAAFILAALATGQRDGDCGTQLTPVEVQTSLTLLQSGAYEQPEGVAGPGAIVIPLTFHVVCRSDGGGGIAPAQLSQALLDANSAFAPLGVSFCTPGPALLIFDDDFYFAIDTQAEIDALRQTDSVPRTINVYFTPNLTLNGGTLCGISSFSFSTFQGIVMRNGCTGLATDPSTFPHELGHYFDLFHTHETAYGIECADGSNCGGAGDVMCDTPADPLLTPADVSPNCEYTGAARDNCRNSPFQPDTANFMSYSLRTCRTSFSAQQRQRARAALLNRRPELVNATCPPACAGLRRCDLNCDGRINNLDLDGFCLAVLDAAAYARAYPSCSRICAADANRDGRVNSFDIDAFVACLLSPE